MNQRIKDLKENIQNLNDAGVRETYLYQYVAESLNETEGEPTQIRRAKAFAHVLKTVEQQVLPYEKLAGTMLGMCPLYENVMSKEEQHDYATKVIEEYLAKKKQDRILTEASSLEKAMPKVLKTISQVRRVAGP